MESFDLETGSERSLVSKLHKAEKCVAQGNIQDACGALKAFVNEVNAQAKVPNKELHQNPEEADQLIAAANAIRAVLGCY